MENQADQRIFERVRSFVRQEMEEPGRERPVPLDEISRALDIREEDIIQSLAQNVETFSLVDMDLFVTFRE